MIEKNEELVEHKGEVTMNSIDRSFDGATMINVPLAPAIELCCQSVTSPSEGHVTALTRVSRLVKRFLTMGTKAYAV